jgi:glycosyltransferase involved in cell wall biosynthesis
VGLSCSGPILGFSSTDTHQDIELILEALAMIAGKYPSVKLIITGHVKKSIIDLARAYGVERNIHLTGYLPFEELPWYLGCADIFVLPFPNKIYNVGRWPNKICDFMCLGRPTVSNPFGDIKTLFENNSIGLLAECNPEDFSNKVFYLIEHPDVAEQLGKEARRVAETQYNWRVLTDKLESFYYRILNV